MKNIDTRSIQAAFSLLAAKRDAVLRAVPEKLDLLVADYMATYRWLVLSDHLELKELGTNKI